MNTALIGYTGFVGSTLMRSRHYSAVYNSKNSKEMEGMKFDTVICAGVSAAKWWANQHSSADRFEIEQLMHSLAKVTARRFVLISTIDVYHETNGVDEAVRPAKEFLHPYGAHRLMLEEFVRAQFEDSVIIRLPGLFGPGLRKNIIFDFLNQNQTAKINPTGRLQWYPIRKFPGDLEKILSSDIDLINIAVEPVLTEEIRQRFFPKVPIGEGSTLGPQYDMQTSVASLLGGKGRYHLDSAQMLSELEVFIDSERSPK